MPVNSPAEVIDPVATVAAAENEALCLDILVCGNCQSVFHFSEEFQEHKLRNDCVKADKSIVNQQQNTKKPQVWAFLIWKNSQQKADDQQGSWKLYQKWCNMPDVQRQSWVTAGRNIQTFINLSHARELNKTDNIFSKEVDQAIEDDLEEDFAVEKVVGKRYNQKKKQVEYLLKWEGYPAEQNTWEPLSNLTTCKSLLQEYERSIAQNDRGFNSRLTGVLRKDGTLTPVKLPNANAIKPAGIISNKFSLSEKKNEVTTPTLSLQTQRKIVPVTPLSNSVTPSKLTTPLLSTLRSDLHKTIDTGKLVNSVDTSNDLSKLSKSNLNSSPLKKRVLPNSEGSITPITAAAVSSEKLSPSEKLKTSEKSKVSEKTKEWCVTIDDEPVAIKRVSDTPTSDATEDVKRIKMTETSNEEVRKEDETIEIPKSGIFKKSDLKEKYPSINNMFGKANENGDSKLEVPKNGENLRGILKVDHGQMPDLVSGVYRMSVKAGIVKIDSLANNDKQLTATLPVMPGPKGGVLILGTKFDLSKIAKSPIPKSPHSIDRMNASKAECLGLRGIIPKHKLDDSPTKSLKPDFNSKLLCTPDSSKKQVSSSLRKVLGNTVPSKKGKPSLSSPTGGITRFKPTYIKSQGDTYSDSSSSKLGEGDGLQLEFNDLENSDAEEYALPDDFPEEINMEPLSPGRPLTLDPETGKRLMRAEGEPTPLPTPEPSPVPSPIPPQIICKEENEALAGSDNIILKTDETGEGTFAEINGNTYKVTSTDEVGLLQNATFAQADAVPVTNLTDEDGNETGMLTITGDDGLVYQVANAKLEGDTIVVASGEDEQQCVFVTDDGHQVMQRTNEDGSTVLTLGSAFGDAVAQLVPNQVNILPDGSQIYVKQEDNGQVELVQIQGSEMTETEGGEQEEPQIEAPDDNSGQVVAQLIEASDPTPGGGPRRVVLLLPDGNLMVTEVDEEQFAALELEK